MTEPLSSQALAWLNLLERVEALEARPAPNG
jgi:hypothetical protein